jgi:hypothetical protein
MLSQNARQIAQIAQVQATVCSALVLKTQTTRGF